MEASLVAQAVKVAFTHAGQEGQEARSFLEKFQNSLQAWNIVELMRPNFSEDVQFFAASCLKHKVIHDLAQLHEAQAVELEGFLFQERPLPSIVKVQVTLAKAALVVQAGHYEPILNSNHVDTLSTVPEMLSNRAIPSIQKPSPQTMEVAIQHLLQAGDFGAVSAWMDCVAKYSEPTSGSMLKDAGFLQQLFQHWRTLHDVVAKVITLNVDCLDKQWLSALVSGVKALDNAKPALAIAVAVGEFFLDLLLDDYCLLDKIICVLLDQGIESESSADVESTLNVWEYLAERAYYPEVYADLLRRLMRSKHLRYPLSQLAPSAHGNNDAQASNENDKEHYDDREEEEDERELEDEEALDEFREFRHVLGDTVKVCVEVLGSSESLRLVQERHAQSRRINERESVMFVLRVMASAVDRHECEVLPPLLRELLLQGNDDQSDPLVMRYAKNLLIGSYADWAMAQGRPWVAQFGDYLMRSFQLAWDVRAGGLDASAVQSMAARALMYLAESDNDQPLERFFPLTQYHDTMVKLIVTSASDSVVTHIMSAVALWTCNDLERYGQLVALIPRHPARLLPAYGSMLSCLESNGRMTEEVVVRLHCLAIFPLLCQLAQDPNFGWREDYLAAVGAFLLPDPSQICSLTLQLYCQRRLPGALSLAKEERCRPHWPELLETCAQHFLPDSAADFCSVLQGAPEAMGPRTIRVLLQVASEAQLGAVCALQLCDLLVHGIADPFIDIVTRTALLHWPMGSVSELGRALWRAFKHELDSGDSFFRHLLVDLLPIEQERGFYTNLARDCLRDVRPRSMKQFAMNLADLVRRRRNLQ